MADKSLLRTCYFENAKGARKCSRNKAHAIVKGEKCLVFTESMRSPASYCIACAEVILRKGQASLEKLTKELT